MVTASPVKDLTEAEETGREVVVSGASSNESCSRSELSALDHLVSFPAIVVLCEGSRRQDSSFILPLCSFPLAKCQNHQICNMQGSSGPRLDTRRASNGHRVRLIT